MTEEMKRERLQEIIDSLDETEIITMWNNICADSDVIYDMNELDEFFISCKSATNIIDSLDDDFSTSDYYFADGDLGVKSFDDIYDIVDDDELINYMLDNDDDFGNDDIRGVLDEELTDEDEEDE